MPGRENNAPANLVMSIPTSKPSPPSPNPLASQLRLFQRLAAGLTAALLVGAGAFFYVRHLGQPVTIFVNGKPAATVANRATANSLIAAAEQAKVGTAYATDDAKRMQSIVMLPAAANTPQETDSAVKSKLAVLLTLHLKAFVILVNGHPSVALPTPDAATDTLRIVKDHWAKLPPTAELEGEPQIVEEIAIEKRVVDTSLIRQDAASAAPYFWTPPPLKSYKVQRGDIGSRIARRNHISLTDLITANPNVNINRLKQGNVLNVRKMPRLLTVRVRKTMTTEEPVHPNAPAEQAGRQRVTYVVTYLNGQETRREAKEVTLLEKPLTRMDL